MSQQQGIQDVVIIGGGPAGSTAAAFLSMQGHRVTVLEKEKFPREHVGESLLPFCYSILEQLGVLDQLADRFVRKPGVRFIDVDGSHETTWCFGHVIKDESYLSFHVLRCEFDQILLNNAARLGATVHEETAVQSVKLDRDDGIVEVRARGADGEPETYRGRFLIDASGRDTFLANRNGWKKPHQELDRVAFSTHWVGGKYIEGIEEGLLQIVYLGGNKKGWIWVIPVGRDRLSIGVVLNNSYIRTRKSRLTADGVKDWQSALYRHELKSSPFVADVIENAETLMPLMVNGDYSYTMVKKYGKNFAMIGDASTFIDPIFASGIYLSTNSARLVAQALHKKFTQAEDEGDRALEEAYGKINGAYQLVDKAIRLFYHPDAINFAQIGSASGFLHERQKNALAVGHYLLAGDFFDRHESYSKFIDLLQDPTMFRRYQKTVLEREELQASTCGLQPVEVFHRLLNDQAEL